MNADAPLNLAQLARHAGVSRSTVWRWVEEGSKVLGTNRLLRLPVQRIGGRWKVSLFDFELWQSQLKGERTRPASARSAAYARDLEAFRSACRRS